MIEEEVIERTIGVRKLMRKDRFLRLFRIFRFI